jgi:hypothetical protein
MKILQMEETSVNNGVGSYVTELQCHADTSLKIGDDDGDLFGKRLSSI